MFEDIPSKNFGLNYDPSHMIWQQMDYVAPLRDFKDRLFHIHAKDVRIDRHRLDQVGIMAPPNEYHTPKLTGMGDVTWGHFLTANLIPVTLGNIIGGGLMIGLFYWLVFRPQRDAAR